MIEWYDFFIFGSLAVVLSQKFYPPGNETFAYIAYLSTFAVGFVVRPFGALFFGRIGDRVGRKYAFLVTLSLMGGATALIGFLPSFKTGGWISPVILILIRVLQGLAVGGEYGGAVVYVAEHVPDNKRGYYTSFIQITERDPKSRSSRAVARNAASVPFSMGTVLHDGKVGRVTVRFPSAAVRKICRGTGRNA